MKEFLGSNITVIIPTLNEEKGIGPTIKDLEGILGESRFLVIDGNSSDRTVDIAKQMGVEVIEQTGRGKGEAILQALVYVNPSTRYVVFIDGDFTYPAKYVTTMIGILEKHSDVGMVSGNRFNGKYLLIKDAMHNVNYFGNRLIAAIHYLLNGANLKDPLTGMRVVRWDILKKWSPTSKGFDIEVELNHYIYRSGYLIVEIPIEYRQRLGEKKLKWRHGFTILKRIITQRFSMSTVSDEP